MANNPPPPLPVRLPGHAVRTTAPRVQGIDTLRPEPKQNDYVDTTSIGTPRLPPRSSSNRSKVDSSAELKTSITKTNERHQNLDNERLEQLSAQQSPPTLPPRGESSLKPPPVPMRMNASRTLPPQHQAPVPNGVTVSRSLSARGHHRHQATNNAALQPTVLVITQAKSFTSKLPSLGGHTSSRPITTQPTLAQPMTMRMDKRSGEMKNSIICPKCGECRCSSCTADRQLPERWLCQGNCRCSASSVVDALTCMCVVKAIFQHCQDNQSSSSSLNRDDDWQPGLPTRQTSSTDICSCSAEVPNCCLRWSALATLSAVLPCLCCYWPLQGGVAGATACYNSSCCRRKGCTCNKD